MGRTFRLMLIMLIAGGVPFAWFNDQLLPTLQSKWQQIMAWSPSGTYTDTPVDWGPDAPALGGHFPVSHSSSAPVRQTRSKDSLRPPSVLDEVLRFSIDRRWITSRWPRISTVLADQNLSGLRVPLVTGTDATDLAGSLSYYFDEQGRVQRIAFDGHSGDERQVVAFVTNEFQLRAEPTLGAGLFVARWNGKPTSGLIVHHAAIVRANDPNGRYRVRFEINRPKAGYSLSPEFRHAFDQHNAASVL